MNQVSDKLDAQWRLSAIQLANWGTFDGAIYRINISRKGHLITGPSGSGKSTLLDAIASVLTPDIRLRFNTAAQGTSTTSDKRTRMSYVRGAWVRKPDEDEDRLRTQYLRPGATWSGIILQYRNMQNEVVSLARLYFAKGSGTSSADLSSIRMIVPGPLDLTDIQPYARSGLDVRGIKRDWPKALVTGTGQHAAFFTRLERVFGMNGPTALSLLHKTQSTKNLGSLDQLFREYMLPAPETFKVADNAAEQFSELSDAHKHVVQLRQQRDHLLRMQQAITKYHEAEIQVQQAAVLADSVEAYRAGTDLDLAEQEKASEERNLRNLHEQLAQADSERVAAAERRDAASRVAHGAGASDIRLLRERIRDAEATLQETQRRWEQFTRRLDGAGVKARPDSSASFAELKRMIETDLAANETVSGASHHQHERLAVAKRDLRRTDEQIDAIRKSRSGVDGRLLALRERMASELGLYASHLPFAAELMEVRPEFAEWTGAIERVLRSFGLTMLVAPRYLPKVREWVDRNDLGTSLTYQVTSEEEKPIPIASKLSLVNRISVKQGPAQAWVQARLSDSFDFACVDLVEDLGRYRKALTINGQMQSGKGRYVKDDRYRISDRGRWVLGDPAAKLDALVEKRLSEERVLDEARAAVDAAEKKADQLKRRNAELRTIASHVWDDVDTVGPEQKLAQLRAQLRFETSKRHDLQAALAALDVAEADLQRADARSADLSRKEGVAEDNVRRLDEEVTQIRAEGVERLDASIVRELHRRFHSKQRNISRTQLPAVSARVARELRSEEARGRGALATAGEAISSLATAFGQTWPGVAANLSTSVADRDGYMAILEEITARRLPDHEQRFLDLLRTRSRELVGQLRSDILEAPRQVEERIEPINVSLSRSEYAPGTHLRLRVKRSRPQVAEELLADLRAISEGSWHDSDLEAAEMRFALLARLMKDFSSSEPDKMAWRKQALDTRLHVSFVAEEIGEQGRVVASYDSGNVLSGGEQQKLVFFCLASALRYQLTQSDQEIPAYGTVVLDEAFDKADEEYTRTALQIFNEFGLHLVVATPHKLLQTIEPFIGGTTTVANPERSRTIVSDAVWEGGYE